RDLSDRLVAAQRPLRILEAVNWDERVERDFFAAGASRQPAVTADTYRDRPLGFDPDAKQAELKTLRREVQRTLGKSHPAGRLLLRRCAEYRLVVDLLAARARPSFSTLSRRLYGAPARARAEKSMFTLMSRHGVGVALDSPHPELDAEGA